MEKMEEYQMQLHRFLETNYGRVRGNVLQLYDFLTVNHTSIGDELFLVGPDKIHSVYDSEAVIYESKDGKIAITITYRGAVKGWIQLRYEQKAHLLYYDFFPFVKYLEWNRRNQTFPKVIMDYIAEEKKAYEEEGKPLSPTEPCDLTGYIGNQDNRSMIEDGYHIPDIIKIDGEVIEKADFTEDTIEQMLDRLRNGSYKRVEVSFEYEMGMECLVYLCEDGKAMSCYFSDEEKFVGVFFENRNDAGLVPADKLPRTTLRGQDIYEQNVVLDHSVLGAIFLEMLRDGRIELYSKRLWRREGYFSGRKFSNKNAYIKQRTQKGEF